VKLHARSKQKRGITDASLSFKSGRSGSKIGPYSQIRPPDRPPASHESETPRTLRDNRLPAARCMQATVFGKIDDLLLAPLRVHIDAENQV
jgi:hypothetical protein